MKQEHFLRSLREQAQGNNQRNSVVGFYETAQNSPFNQPLKGQPQGQGGGVPMPLYQPNLEAAKRELTATIRLLLKALPSITDIEALEIIEMNIGEVLNKLGFDSP